MIEFIFNASLLVLIIFAVTYVWYCIALSLVLARIQAKWWKAFIPLYNLSELVHSIGLPKKWFFLSITPYIGTVYAIAIAYRLGQIWKKNFAFSAFWLTIAAPIGFLILSFSKQDPDLSVAKLPPPSLSVIKAKLSKKNKKIQKQNQ